MSNDLSRDEVVKPGDFKFKHADMLNRLHEMQRSPYYATACHTLIQAEMAIVGLEQDIAPLVAEVERLTQQCKLFQAATYKAQAEAQTLVEAADAELASMKAGEPVAWRKKSANGEWVLYYQNVGWKDLSGFEPLYPIQKSAVKVVREMVEALNGIDQGIDLSKYPYAPDDITLLDITQAALEAGQQFLKENKDANR